MKSLLYNDKAVFYIIHMMHLKFKNRNVDYRTVNYGRIAQFNELRRAGEVGKDFIKQSGIITNNYPCEFKFRVIPIFFGYARIARHSDKRLEVMELLKTS